LGTESTNATIVFDAAGAPAGATDEQEYRGIQVRFSVHHQQADDLIEALIRQDSAPKQLTVVSDDHRIQGAARRRQCRILGCLDFLEEVERTRRQRLAKPVQEPEKEIPLGQDVDCWLRAFADLDNEPEMKELFHPFDFGEDQNTNRP
jgi:predicted RNA-binding protein with PIN domain